MFGSGLTRRSFMTGAMALGGYGLWDMPSAIADPECKKFAGTPLEVNLIKSPRGDMLQKYEKEFDDLTGIKVYSEQIPEQQQRQKAVIELTSGKPSFDVVASSYHVQKRQFEKAGWLADLTPFMKDRQPDRPDPDRERFLRRPACSTPRTRRARCAPCRSRSTTGSSTGTRNCSRRRASNIPTTFDELVKAAEALTDPAEGTFGFVARGLQERQRAGLDELPARLRRRLRRRRRAS